jgi:DNA-binding beta-propeller fold protein YncE
VQLPNGWSLKPAGRQTPLGDFPILIAECPTAPVLAVLHAGYGDHEVLTLNPLDGKTIGRAVVPETFGGMVWSADGRRLFVGGGFDEVIYRFDHADGLLSNRKTLTGRGADVTGRAEVADDGGLLRAERGSQKAQGCLAGLALSADGKTLWAADAFAHRLVRLDAETGALRGELALEAGSYPYGLKLDEKRGRLYVSLWNRAKVAIVDVKGKDTLAGHYETQEHPNEMLLLKGGDYLLVANANRNTVTVIDTKAGRAVETIGTAIAPEAPSGSTPNSLALTPDETILLVANANTNDVAVVNVEEPGESKPLGLIPVGWYPTSVRVARDGKTIYVANGKGSSSRANRDGPNPLVRGGTPIREYIGGLFRGTLSTVPMPSPARMGEYTKAVYACSPLNKRAPAEVAVERPADSPIPGKVGEPSPITHCVYIIKENRTYDQVFGDMPKGNGEPALCLFPERVTPNHHALADEFVLLDNFYVESEVSADGHEWTMAAYATDFVERVWPISYRGDKRAPYPAEGKLDIATPAGGYLWDRAKAKGVSYFSFGEFVDNPPRRGQPATTRLESLKGNFDPLFWGYDLNVQDQERADRFLQVLAEWEQKGEMPRLITLRLPNDHTSGTRPGAPTVTAMVADNDLALGRVVEGLSKSRFWPNLAIFVVEDDAQNGSDHVDAHRTVALAISPYIKKGTVDSTLYSTSSMLRTMELILGLDPMSQFDAAARPMYGSFGPKPDPTPYRARPAGVDLKAINLADAPMAAESLALDLSKEDAADDLVFNEIIWKAVRGKASVMPPPVRAAFVLPRGGDEDEDEEGDDD